MKRMFLAGLIAVLAACGAPKSAEAPIQELGSLPDISPNKMVDETPKVWFVELSGVPTSDGVSLQSVTAQHQVFRQAAKTAGVKVRAQYTRLFNGFSVETKGVNAQKLFLLPGVKAVWPVVNMQLPTQETPKLDLANAISQTGVDIAQNDLGLTGQGIRVGILDSGMDRQHPAFQGRVVAGYDFVGDNWDPNDPANSELQPDADWDDCGGHGTHVAGIVGGKDSVITGVAPKVEFGAYKIGGCGPSISTEGALKALEAADADGMDVLNLSWGSPSGWGDYPIAQAFSRLVQRGVVVVASAGNSGASGLFTSGSPSSGEDVISVASFDNIAGDLPYFVADSKNIGFSAATGGATPATTGSLPLAVAAPLNCCNVSGASPFPAGSFTGKAVLIQRGSCTFREKALNATAAGAEAVIIFNNVKGRFGATVAGEPAIAKPVLTVSDAEGLLLSGLTGSAAAITWTDKVAAFPYATGNQISSFSSWGLSQDLGFKPDLGAPGGFIKSAYPIEQGTYAVLSGTSMSSPHVAGAVALLLEGHPDFARSYRATTVRTYLQNTAYPKESALLPNSGIVDASFRQGAGMINVFNAVQNRVLVTPAKISFAQLPGAFTQTLTLRNKSDVPLIYKPKHVPGVSAYGSAYGPSFNTAIAGVTFSADRVRVPARGEITLRVTIKPNANLANRGLYGGYVVFEPVGAGTTLSVPYAGMKGGYTSVKVLEPTEFNFPLLARTDASGIIQDITPEGGTYTLEGDFPSVLAHFEHGARLFQVEIIDAITNESVAGNFSKAYDSEYISRNTSRSGFRTFPWDGSRISKYQTTPEGFRIPSEFKNVPDGEYKLVVKVLKPKGNVANPLDWETWVSPNIIIDRP
jgi:minor extracellular serine protease Vpr